MIEKKDIPKADVYVILDTDDNSFTVIASRTLALEQLSLYPGQMVCYPINIKDESWLTLNVTVPRPPTLDEDYVNEFGVVDIDEAMV